MTAYFVDSSAGAKVYIAERGSHWITGLIDPALGHDLFVVRITAIEVGAALFRRVRAGLLSTNDVAAGIAALRYDLGHLYRVVELSPELAEMALNVAERHRLRGYDCVQLAAALAIHRSRLAANISPLTLISADEELNLAAETEGIEVEDPNNYP